VKNKVFLFVLTLFTLTVLGADSKFMEKSKITGKVMEFNGSKRYIRGNFRVENPSYILTAFEGMVDEKKNIMEARGRVKLIEDKYTLTCNKLIYYINEDKDIAIGSPKIVERATKKDTEENVLTSSTITGEKVTTYVKEDRVVVDGNVKVKKVNIENGKEVLDYILYCDNLTYYNKISKAIAIGNVKIERKDSIAYGDKLVFYDNQNRIEIVGNAFIKRNTGDKIMGEKIIYFTDTDRILVFKAKAEVIQSSKGFDLLNSNYISIV
jgi:lipopolysaccharide export system protein LptA